MLFYSATADRWITFRSLKRNFWTLPKRVRKGAVVRGQWRRVQLPVATHKDEFSSCKSSELVWNILCESWSRSITFVIFASEPLCLKSCHAFCTDCLYQRLFVSCFLISHCDIGGDLLFRFVGSLWAETRQRQQIGDRVECYVCRRAVPTFLTRPLEVPEDGNKQTIRVYARDARRGSRYGMRYVHQGGA